jgi:hypothetical protein
MTHALVCVVISTCSSSGVLSYELLLQSSCVSSAMLLLQLLLL